ncbi:MAG: 1,4-dihydroxy-2-naphthoate polyprenyltransferase [Actinobacteria bacterium]|nr:1,4-dihydroxy-2-naphthoate polyprenyltransferase [Actinomycetota bacterium]
MKLRIWVQGARPRTLGAAFAPVVVGSALAAAQNSFQVGLALLALLVALGLQVGVNYANDYSDGVRGTDANRVGPTRLVGQGLASPKAVKNAAFFSFAIALVAGVLLSITSEQLWLLPVGLVAVFAAWFYTGGKNPYGYRGFGEVVAFVFFGPVAVLGTSVTQLGKFDINALWGGLGIGCFAAALLLINNIRDVPSDIKSGKRTLAVKIGAKNARSLYLLLLVAPFFCLVPLAGQLGNGVFVGLVAAPLALLAYRPTNPVRALGLTSLAELVFALTFSIGVLGFTGV